MKKYWFKDLGFANCYDVVYTTSAEEEKEAIEREYERITYAEARRLVIDERYRSKHDEMFSGYAPKHIFHLNCQDDPTWPDMNVYDSPDGYVMVRR